VYGDSPLCRHHHRVKQADGWRLDQPLPGVLGLLPGGNLPGPGTATGPGHCRAMSIKTRTAAIARTLAAGTAALGIAAAALAAGTAAASAATAPATGIGVQLLDGSGQHPSWMQASLARGTAKTWHVKMTNTGTATETAAAVASSQLSFASGGPARQPAATLQPWITYSPAQAQLDPGQSATITVTVTVPAAAPLGLVPGSSANPDLAINTLWAYAAPAGTGQIQLATAAGIRMYITVTP